MLVFELFNDHKKYIYRLPQKASEVTVERFIEFQKTVESKKPETLLKYESLEGESERNEYLSKLDDDEVNVAWVSYYMREIAFWCNMNMEHAAQLPVNIQGEPLPGEVDLFGLRAMLHQAFMIPDELEEEIESFKHNGKTYYLPEMSPALIGDGEDYMRKTTIGEFATASELRRVFNMQHEGSIEGLLYLLAVLCKKKNEKFPVMPDEQTQYIRDRVNELKDIDLQTALKVGFFLTMRRLPSKAVFPSFPGLEKAMKAVLVRNTVIT